MKVQGHASSLLCSRRNEGDHRSIKMEARLTPNISGPWLSVRLRREQTRELTCECSFVILGEKWWGRRGRGSITNSLLSNDIPEWKLKDMSFSAKVRAIYGTTLKIQFMNVSDIKEDHTSFVKSIPCARPVRLFPVDEEKIKFHVGIFHVNGFLFYAAGSACECHL